VTARDRFGLTAAERAQLRWDAALPYVERWRMLQQMRRRALLARMARPCPPPNWAHDAAPRSDQP
jgi:hypothetical protein